MTSYIWKTDDKDRPEVISKVEELLKRPGPERHFWLIPVSSPGVVKVSVATEDAEEGQNAAAVELAFLLPRGVGRDLPLVLVRFMIQESSAMDGKKWAIACFKEEACKCLDCLSSICGIDTHELLDAVFSMARVLVRPAR